MVEFPNRVVKTSSKAYYIIISKCRNFVLCQGDNNIIETKTPFMAYLPDVPEYYIDRHQREESAQWFLDVTHGREKRSGYTNYKGEVPKEFLFEGIYAETDHLPEGALPELEIVQCVEQHSIHIVKP